MSFLFFAKIKTIHQMAMIGRANVDILNSPKPSPATTIEETVVPIFAQMITPIAFESCNTPAPTNQRRMSETKLLLWSSAVAHVPVTIDLNAHLVYFCSILLSVFQPKTLIDSSNICIPKIRIPIPANNCRISNCSIKQQRKINKINFLYT
jgi:hypothetical protein